MSEVEEAYGAGICGRPTVKGGACGNRQNGAPRYGRFKAACPIHQREEDQIMEDLLHEAFILGQNEGVRSMESQVSYAKLDARNEAQREWEKRECVHMRQRDQNGRQLIVASNGYTYHWTGQTDLEVGDTIFVPGNEWNSWTPKPSHVVATSSDYTGETKAVTV